MNDRFDFLSKNQYLVDRSGRTVGLFLDCGQHEQNPWFPCLLAGYVAQKAVIVRTVIIDIARKEEDRQIETPAQGQVQYHQDTAGSAIAVIEGMDGLKLVVEDGISDKWINLDTRLIVIIVEVL